MLGLRHLLSPPGMILPASREIAIVLIFNNHCRWQADAFTAVSFSVPNNWQAGRIWVRLFPGSSHMSHIHIATCARVYSCACHPRTHSTRTETDGNAFLSRRPVVTVTSTIPTQPLNAQMAAAMVVLCAILTLVLACHPPHWPSSRSREPETRTSMTVGISLDCNL